MSSYLLVCKYANYIGAIVTLIAQAACLKRVSRKSLNPVKNFVEDSSEEVAVRVNSGLIHTILMSAVMLLAVITKNIGLLNIGLAVCAVVRFVEILGYVPFFHDLAKSSEDICGIPEKCLGLMFKFFVMHLCLMFLLADGRMEFVINKLTEYSVPQQAVEIFTIGFIMLAIYGISNSLLISAYTMIGLLFSNVNLVVIQEKMKKAESKNSDADKLLKQETTKINELAETQRWTANIIMAVRYVLYNFKIYFVKYKYSMLQLLHYMNYGFKKRMKEMLNGETFGRFCKVCFGTMAVTILILTNIYLYVNFSSESAVVHFYELLSTVIIIPIVMAKISEGK